MTAPLSAPLPAPSAPEPRADQGGTGQAQPAAEREPGAHPTLLRATAADLVLRVAYQMGKAPLLPLFAVSLGAGPELLGMIVAVSTVTGMLSKPLFGWLSDRRGRRTLLLWAVVVMTLVPFGYVWVATPSQLFGIRLLHGLGTAILGPAAVACVAEIGRARVAERLGWFGTARSLGYILGPLLAAWLLLELSAQHVYVVIGLVSSLALWPIIGLRDERKAPAVERPAVGFGKAMLVGAATPSLWMAGGVEAVMYAAITALKSFLPVVLTRAGVHLVWVGTFFAVLEGSALVCKPLAGRVGDRVGQTRAIGGGLLLMAAALVVQTQVSQVWALLPIAGLLGVGQALISPTMTGLISLQLSRAQLGSGMGLVGSLKNLGKVVGPVLAGLAIGVMGYELTIASFALSLLAAALLVAAFRAKLQVRPQREAHTL